MRILQMGKHYPPQYGGMETVLQNITEGLLDAGDEVMVLATGEMTLESRETVSGPLTGRSGTLVRLANMGNWNSQPLALDIVNSLRKAVTLFQPELIHMHLPNPLAAAAWLAWQRLEPGPRPVLAVWHHADISKERRGRRMVRPFVDSCLKQARGICVSSPTLEATSWSLAKFRDKVRVIPFGIADAGCREIGNQALGPFLFVGRLVAYKGLKVLLAALANVPAAELDIVGSGPQENELRHFVRERGLDTRVHFHGKQTPQNLAMFYAKARALILPSIDSRETFGVVQLEAMSAGVPVVATDLPTGVAAVGKVGETGFLVPPGDDHALEVALRALQQDPALVQCMGQAGRTCYLEYYTRSRMIEDLRRWYDVLLLAEGPGE